MSRLLNWRLWVRLFQALGMRERILVSSFAGLGLVALIFWFGAMYVSATKVVPEAGGEYSEGMISQPRYINPILSQTSEADADLVKLIFTSLFDYDKDGKLEKLLAQDYSVSDDGKLYTVTLKPGVKWQDGEELTADDVLFTINAIQDPAYKSPLRSNWLSVDVATVDRYTLTFTLKKTYFGFLENLTVGILPKHIWENISSENFLLADYNLAPVGSGPYRFFDSEKDSNGNILSYELRPYEEYFDHAPYISKLTLHFYPDQETLLDAYSRKEIMGINTAMPESLAKLQERKSTRVQEINVPRIFAVFFNTTKNAALAHDEVRSAIAYATDRNSIISEVLKGKGQEAYTAFLPFMEGYAADLAFPRFDENKANQILEDNGWVRGADGVRAKGGVILEFELKVPDWPELTQTAELLKTQWGKVGIRTNIVVLGAADLQQSAIRPREYQALLFGEAAMINSDPYSFWHSSQKHDPGLNLSLFDDKKADDVLLDLREELDDQKRMEMYKQFQEILLKENPAVFLYSPTYLYVVNNSVQGLDVKDANAPAYRLSNVENWYINTKRVAK